MRPSPSLKLSPLRLTLDKVHGLLARHGRHARALADVAHAVALLGYEQHLRPEGGADELRVAAAALAATALAGRVVGARTQRLQHARHRGAVLRVQVRVDLVEEVEGRRVAALDGEDQGEGAQTCVAKLH